MLEDALVCPFVVSGICFLLLSPGQGQLYISHPCIHRAHLFHKFFIICDGSFSSPVNKAQSSSSPISARGEREDVQGPA